MGTTAIGFNICLFLQWMQGIVQKLQLLIAVNGSKF